MTAPTWIDSAIGEFGKSAGLGTLSLGDRNSAALSFQNGLVLRFEYAFNSLSIAITAPMRLDAASACARDILRSPAGPSSPSCSPTEM